LPHRPVVSWSAYPIPRRQSYLGWRIPSPHHNLLSWPACSFNAAQQFLDPTRAVPPHESISVGGGGVQSFSAGGYSSPCYIHKMQYLLAPALWLYQNQNCDITLALAQPLLCQNQSLFNLYFYLLPQLLHCASNHCCITLYRSHHGTHIYFPNQPPCRNHSVSYQLAHHHCHPIIYYINTHLSFNSTYFQVQDSFLHQPQLQDMSCLADTDLFLRTMDHQDTFCTAFCREGGYQYHNSLLRIDVQSR
jgi:hypothetical protein